MQVQNWQYSPERQVVTGEIAYTITDDVTGEVIPRVGRLEVPASDVDVRGIASLDDLSARIAAALSPKTAGKVAVGVAERVVLALDAAPVLG